MVLCGRLGYSGRDIREIDCWVEGWSGAGDESRARARQPARGRRERRGGIAGRIVRLTERLD